MIYTKGLKEEETIRIMVRRNMTIFHKNTPLEEFSGEGDFLKMETYLIHSYSR